MLIGDTILHDVYQRYQPADETNYALLRSNMYIDQVLASLNKVDNDLTPNVIVYIGSTDASSVKFCPTRFKAKVKTLIRRLQHLGAKRIIFCSIIPKIGLENDRQYWSNLERVNSSLFYVAGEAENGYYAHLFKKFVVAVHQAQSGPEHQYFNGATGLLKYQPKMQLYETISGSGVVQQLRLNDRGMQLVIRNLSSFMSVEIGPQLRPVREMLSRESKISNVVSRKVKSNSKKSLKPATTPKTLGSCFQDILEENDEPAVPVREDLPCWMPIRVFNAEIDAMVDEGCPHMLLDQDLYEQICRKHPELTRLELPAHGTAEYQGAMGTKKCKPSCSVALPYSYGDGIFEGESFYTPCVIIKNLNAKMLLGRDWRKQFGVKTDSKNDVIGLHNPNNQEYVEYSFADRSRKHAQKDALVWSNYDISVSEQVNNLCAQKGDIDSFNEQNRQKLIAEAEAQIDSTVDELDHLQEETRTELKILLKYFKAAFRNEVGCCNKYVHSLEVSGLTKLRCKNRPLNRMVEAKVREVIREWILQGIIVKSDSPYRVPLMPVEKKNGTYRPCGDFRPLNKFMVMHGYEVPRISDLQGRLKGAKYFTRLDFRESFLQVGLDKDSQLYCCFNFDGIPYQFTRVPFGTRDSMPAFIKMMSMIMEGTEGYVIHYVDDILIFSKTLKEHLKHIKEVLRRIQGANLTLNVQKCEWIKTKVEFLGLIISENGAEPNPEKVSGITDFPEPKTKRQLQSFLGMMNFYRAYIPNCATISVPLYEISSPHAKFKWTDTHQSAFNQLKFLLAEATIHQHPDFSKPFYVRTDASSIGVAGAIYQLDDDDNVRPIVFTSRVLNKAEKNYKVLEQELLAIIHTLKKNYYILLGSKIFLYTDHQPLTFSSTHPYPTGRLIRWMLYLNCFDISIEYIPGKENIVADALSRYHKQLMAKATPLYTSFNVIEYQGQQQFEKQIARLKGEQLNDVLVKQYIGDAQSVPKMMKNCDNEFFMWRLKGDNYRIYVPHTLRKDIMHHYHGYYIHPGVWKMANMIRRVYNWPGLLDDVAQYVRNCIECKVIKSRNENLHGPLKPIVTSAPGELVCVDFFGPLPRARGSCTMILAVMDHFTRFVKLYAMKSANTKNAITAVEKFIAHTGPIKAILSDNGPQFASKEWQQHWADKNVKVRHTSFYTPQSNPAEKIMSTIAEVLRHKTRHLHTKWVEFLHDIEHKHNNVLHKSTGAVPSELMLKKQAPSPTPETIAVPELSSIEAARSTAHKSAEYRKDYFDKTHKLTKLEPGAEVYVVSHQQSDKCAKYSAKLDLKFEGPYQVVKELHDNVYLICDTGNEALFKKNIRELRHVR